MAVGICSRVKQMNRHRSLVALTVSMENMTTASHTKIYMPQQASLEYRGV